MKKIALTVERSRAYGRRFCEGVAEYAQTKGDWSLEFVPDVKGGATHYDGFIFRVLDEDSARRLRSLHKPVVDVFFRQNSGFGVADADNAAISRLAVSHFLTRKFVNFGFCGYDGIRYSDARRDEFVRELAKSDYPCSVYRTPHRILANFTRDVILNECVEEIPDEAELEKWLRGLTLPCAVFCCHDLRSYQLSKICRKIGLRVPEDVAILGVDDDTLLCSFSTPMLSSIDPDAFGIGYEAARILDRMIADAELAGVALEGRERERFNEIQAALARLYSDFGNAVIDATAAFKFEKDGRTYAIDDASYTETMRECEDREVREVLCKARSTRAPDNEARIAEILKLRKEAAALLGFEDFAAKSLAVKCAPGKDAVMDLIRRLDEATAAPAAAEAEEP